MTGTEARWEGIEVALSHEPNDPDGFRVAFERGRAKLAVVYVEGGEEPVVTRFVRGVGTSKSGPDRAEFERKAVAVVSNLASALAWD